MDISTEEQKRKKFIEILFGLAKSQDALECHIVLIYIYSWGKAFEWSLKWSFALRISTASAIICSVK